VTDYKKYSLGQLENFLYDAMGAAEATPQEIYDVIKGVVEDNYYIYKKQASDAYELLALLNGNGEGHISSVISRGNKIHQEIEDILVGIHDDCRIPCDMEALKYTDEELDAMCAAASKDEEYLISKGYFKEDGFWKKPKDKVKKWILPIEEIDCDECIINFPDDLLEAANLKEGDEVEWIDQGDGSFKMIKVTKKEN
jgi:hypothetical protein